MNLLLKCVGFFVAMFCVIVPTFVFLSMCFINLSCPQFNWQFERMSFVASVIFGLLLFAVSS